MFQIGKGKNKLKLPAMLKQFQLQQIKLLNKLDIYKKLIKEVNFKNE